MGPVSLDLIINDGRDMLALGFSAANEVALLSLPAGLLFLSQDNALPEAI